MTNVNNVALARESASCVHRVNVTRILITRDWQAHQRACTRSSREGSADDRVVVAWPGPYEGRRGVALGPPEDFPAFESFWGYPGWTVVRFDGEETRRAISTARLTALDEKQGPVSGGEL